MNEQSKLFKFLFLVLCICISSLVFYIDIKFLPNEITLLLPYVILVSIVTFYYGNKIGFLYSCFSIALWIASASNIFKELTFIIYLNAFIKSVFIFLQYFLIAFIKKKYQEVKTLSLVDELTGLSNRRGFSIFAEYELNNIKRRKEPISLLFIDIDNFKIANDTMGHTEGDKILKELALNIRMSLRKGDIAARLGGDEFCLLLPNVNEEGTKTISKRIKNKFHNACIKSNWPTTLSIGIINTDKEISLEDLIKKGDILMYKAKLEGKNKIEYFKF